MFADFDYIPVIEDYNSDGKMKIQSVLKIFENAANHHSDLAGDYILKGSSDGHAWILTDWMIEMESFPEYGEKVRAVTWSQGATSLFGSSRDYEIYRNDKLCGKGTTRWVRYDLNSNRPAKIEADLMEKYGPESKSVFAESKLPKIEMPESFSSEIVLKPRRIDIDFNHHVHNLVYVDYAMEVLPLEVFGKQDFRNLRITYKSAVKEGDEIKVKYSLDGNLHKVFIFGADDSLKTMIQF